MYNVKFFYTDGHAIEFKQITEIRYIRSTIIAVKGDDILKHLFPTGYDLHLFSDNTNVTVPTKDILYIQVTKET
jgi:hypothetical protein